MDKEVQARRSEKAMTCLGERERKSRWPRKGASNSTARRENPNPKDRQLMEAGVKAHGVVLSSIALRFFMSPISDGGHYFCLN